MEVFLYNSFSISRRTAVKINTVTHIKHLAQRQAHERCSLCGLRQGRFQGQAGLFKEHWDQ